VVQYACSLFEESKNPSTILGATLFLFVSYFPYHGKPMPFRLLGVSQSRHRHHVPLLLSFSVCLLATVICLGIILKRGLSQVFSLFCM
jgi:hypothetical protein